MIKRPCRKCNKYFLPSSKASRVCIPCIKLIMLERDAKQREKRKNTLISCGISLTILILLIWASPVDSSPYLNNQGYGYGYGYGYSQVTTPSYSNAVGTNHIQSPKINSSQGTDMVVTLPLIHPVNSSIENSSHQVNSTSNTIDVTGDYFSGGRGFFWGFVGVVIVGIIIVVILLWNGWFEEND